MIREGWAFLCVVGVWGWIVAGVGFILKAFARRDVFEGKPAALWGGGFLLLYALWIIGMLNS